MRLILLALIDSVYSECSFTQYCNEAPYDCETPIALDSPKPAFALNYSAPYACPMFSGQKVCCNEDQNLNMLFQYLLMDTTFGHAVGGCDVCAANMKLMWCHFTCSPNQYSFVKAGEQKIIPSPANPQQDIKVLLLNYTVTDEFACSLYESCKKCPYVTLTSAMQSPKGFLQFQGYEGSSIGLTWTTFKFENTQSAFNADIATCSSKATNLYGYDIEPCSCNNCEDDCIGDFYTEPPPTLKGIRWVVILITYGVLAFISVIIILGRSFYLKRNRNSSLRS